MSSNTIDIKFMHFVVIVVVIGILIYSSYYILMKSNKEQFDNMLYNMSGFDLLNINANSDGECNEECKKNPDCLFYNYDTRGKKCYLKKGTYDEKTEIGFFGQRLQNGNNKNLNFNAKNTFNAKDANECAIISGSRGGNVWLYDKTNNNCSTGELGRISDTVTMGFTPLYTAECKKDEECPVCIGEYPQLYNIIYISIICILISVLIYMKYKSN